jgi:hypothetical protein
MKSLYKSEKGQMLVMLSAALVALMALTGMAIDVGIAYGVKAKLSAALDAAGIAAGRAVKMGASDDIRKDNALNAAKQFFNANFPSGYMGATVSGITTTPVHSSDGSWIISVSALASVPTSFVRVFGWDNISVGASAETTVRSLDMVLVLDCSGSLADMGRGGGESPPGTFETLKKAAIDNVVNVLQSDGNGDRLGMVTFASGAVVKVPINKTAARGFDRGAMTSAINSLTPEGATDSEEAMRLAKKELEDVPSSLRSSLRVIVFFSDGAPNEVSGMFCNGGSLPGCVGGSWVKGALYSTTNGHADDRAINLFDINRLNLQLSDAGNINILPVSDYTGTINLLSYSNFINNRRSFLTNNVGIRNTKCNVNMAARNMLENVANVARSGIGNDAIIIFVIGYGGALHKQEINFCGYGSDELGENILKRLANVSDVDTYVNTQPSGKYVNPLTPKDLDPAFKSIMNAILRISK